MLEREIWQKKFTNIILLPKLEKPKYLNIFENISFYAMVKDNTSKYQLLKRIWLMFEKNVE